MVGTTDIPDWCYVETYGKDGKDHFTEAPSIDQLGDMYSKSPISHISKVLFWIISFFHYFNAGNFSVAMIRLLIFR